MTSSNHREDDQEMSMDEILASIRRYVSSDEPADKQQVKSSGSVSGSGDSLRGSAPRDDFAKDDVTKDAGKESGFNATDFDDDSTYDDMYPTPPIVTSDRERGYSSMSRDDVVRLADEDAPRPFPRYEETPAVSSGVATPFTPAHHFTNTVPPTMSQAAPIMPSMPFSPRDSSVGLSGGSVARHASTTSPRSYASEWHSTSQQMAYQDVTRQTVSSDTRTGSRMDTLVSDETLSATMESFARLRDASTQTTAPTPLATDNQSGLSNQTLDQLFATLARPMIRDWLDRNLPTMVETMVAKEIERMTRLSR